MSERVTIIDEQYAATADERGYFPLEVLYEGDDTSTVVPAPAYLRQGISFRVLKTNVNGA